MKWIKPSGLEIETNDMPATIEHAQSLGWKEKAAKTAPKKKVKKVKES